MSSEFVNPNFVINNQNIFERILNTLELFGNEKWFIGRMQGPEGVGALNELVDQNNHQVGPNKTLDKSDAERLKQSF